MSVKKCAREECGKTVYPIEELKCLDKVWHKGCFKCTVCGMTLSMKNYKGYDKKPYCEPHYPKTVASVVADTPEMRRLAENTKLQSQVKYHADYEKMRGTKIEITDDPEMARHLANTRVQSQAQYHGELAKKRQQDTQRPKEELIGGGGSDGGQSSTNSSTVALPIQTFYDGATTTQSYYHPQHSHQHSHDNGHHHHDHRKMSSSASYDSSTAVPSSTYSNNGNGNSLMGHSLANGHGGDNRKNGNGTSTNGASQMSQSVNMAGLVPFSPQLQASYHQQYEQSSRTWLGDNGAIGGGDSNLAVADGSSPYSQRLANQAGAVIFSSGRVPAQERQVGSIADYDPINGNWGTSAQNKATSDKNASAISPGSGANVGGAKKSAQKVGGAAAPAPAAATSKVAKNKGFSVKALYDYTAADTDEVSFLENDVIVNCEKVDDGWMTGTVQRTLQYGMLPANYVERVNQPVGMFKLH